MTRRECIEAIRQNKMKKSTYGIEDYPMYECGSDMGYYVQIQVPGSSETLIERSGRTTTKTKSGAWGRVWYKGSYLKEFSGPINIVRQDIIKYLQQLTTDDGKLKTKTDSLPLKVYKIKNHDSGKVYKIKATSFKDAREQYNNYIKDSNQFEVLWYTDKDWTSDPVTKEFSNRGAAMNFYNQHKNDKDKFGWGVTRRDEDWQVLEDLVGDSVNDSFAEDANIAQNSIKDLYLEENANPENIKYLGFNEFRKISFYSYKEDYYAYYELESRAEKVDKDAVQRILKKNLLGEINPEKAQPTNEENIKKDSRLSTDFDYIDRKLKAKGIQFDFSDNTYIFKNSDDAQKADDVISSVVGDRYDWDKRNNEITVYEKNSSDDSITKDAELVTYQFPELTSQDLVTAQKKGLKVVKKSGTDIQLRGTLAQLKDFAKNHLDYELNEEYFVDDSIKKDSNHVYVLKSGESAGEFKEYLKQKRMYYKINEGTKMTTFVLNKFDKGADSKFNEIHKKQGGNEIKDSNPVYALNKITIQEFDPKRLITAMKQRGESLHNVIKMKNGSEYIVAVYATGEIENPRTIDVSIVKIESNNASRRILSTSPKTLEETIKVLERWKNTIKEA